MCGICGIINFNSAPPDEQKIRTMMNIIKHRGPDDEGFYSDTNVALGFVRLSILDLSPAGHQPMFSENERYIIIYNGEVYNYLELRKELLKKNYVFKSATDTEVVLNSFIEWGEGCLDKFNGMWSFVIYDKEKKYLFCARDRFGIKPFYYLRTAESLVFASEIKAILPVLDKHSVKNKLVYEYLVYNRTDQSYKTFFEGIEKLLPGHFMKIENGSIKIKRWYNLSEKTASDKYISPEEYRDLFSSSVSMRLRSDVPLGVCLSGGLDSSSILSVLTEQFGLWDIKTFSAVYPGDLNDESRFIASYNDKIKNMNFISPSADTFWNDFHNFIYTFTEPVSDVNPYAQFKVMELASKYVTVTLDGQGADEQLGGYHYFFGAYYKELLRKWKWIKLLTENIWYIKQHQSVNAQKYFIYFILPSYLRRSVNKKMYGSGLNKDFFNNYKNDSTIGADLYNPVSLRASFLQHFEKKLEHLLKWEDLNSMRFSVEGRIPFLDYRLVEATLSLPAKYIIRKGTTKYILRQSMKDILPEAILNRKDKNGFLNPREKWFRDKRFETYVNDILHSSDFKSIGYFDSAKCIKLHKMHLSGKGNHSKDIWKWINIYVWHNTIIKK